MKPKKLVSVLLLLIFFPVILTGCWDRRELEDQAFVIAIGVDKGKNKLLRVTFRIGVPSKTGLGQSGGGGGGGEGSIAKNASLLTTVEAPSIPAAVILAQGYINRDLSLLHTKGIIFGEAFAKEGVGHTLGFLARYRELRRNIFTGVCKGHAYELLESNAPDLEKSFAKWWEGVKMMSASQSTHPGTLLHEFLSDIERVDKEATMIYFATNDQAEKGNAGKLKAPPSFLKGELGVKAGEIPRAGGNPVEFMGTAVFKGDRLDHILNLTETRSLQMLTGDFKRTFYVIPVPNKKGNYITIELKQGSPPNKKISFKGSEVSIDETLLLEGDLMSLRTDVDYASNPVKMRQLDRIMEKNIEIRLKQLVEKEQKRGIDIVGYGAQAKKYFLTDPEWKHFDWPEQFKKAKINIKVNFAIRRTGMQGEQPGPIE